jgi:hypothetical protein
VLLVVAVVVRFAQPASATIPSRPAVVVVGVTLSLLLQTLRDLTLRLL